MVDKPGQHPKELNPYWKENGTGLPSSSGSSRAEGRSWILRSYKRALEQAKEKNISFEQIAEKQWGSVDKLYSLLRSVGIDPERPNLHHSHDSKEYLYSRSKYDQKHYRMPKDYQQSASKVGSEQKLLPSRSSRTFVCPDRDNVEMTTDNLVLDRGGWKKPGSQTCVAQELSHEVNPLKEETQAAVRSEQSVVQEVITDSMINAKSAKLIKAELTGNQKKIKDLKEEIEAMRTKKKLQEQAKVGEQLTDSKEKIALLTTTDRFGRVRPANMPASYASKYDKKGKSKKPCYSSDEDYSLRALMEMERKMTADDTHLAIAKMASKFVRSSTDDVVDDVLDVKVRTNQQKEQERERNAIKLESRRMEEILDKCRLCVNSSQSKEHLVVAMGINTYLAVPGHQSLTTDHCIIVPIEHTACSLQMDENVWSEVKVFQKGLTRMFSDHDKDVIFTECYSSPARKAHMYIDCIPLPREEGSLAPMYFKKAILESDSEWAQNKRLIDTRSKGLQNSVPLGLPYFFVDFNNEGGFAHVIEDSALFPHYFAKEVVGGLLDADPVLWLKPPHESYDSQKQKAKHLKDMWEPYDWTKKLKE